MGRNSTPCAYFLSFGHESFRINWLFLVWPSQEIRCRGGGGAGLSGNSNETTRCSGHSMRTRLPLTQSFAKLGKHFLSFAELHRASQRAPQRALQRASQGASPRAPQRFAERFAESLAESLAEFLGATQSLSELVRASQRSS